MIRPISRRWRERFRRDAGTEELAEQQIGRHTPDHGIMRCRASGALPSRRSSPRRGASRSGSSGIRRGRYLDRKRSAMMKATPPGRRPRVVRVVGRCPPPAPRTRLRQSSAAGDRATWRGRSSSHESPLLHRERARGPITSRAMPVRIEPAIIRMASPRQATDDRNHQIARESMIVPPPRPAY